MKHTEIDGKKVVHEFLVFWHEWECDGYGWVTEDGRAYLTDHGSRPYEVGPKELVGRMNAVLESVTGIAKALELISAKPADDAHKASGTAAGDDGG